MSLRLVGSAEIVHFLALSRQRVTQLQATEGFPTPLAELAMGKVYDFADIQKWAIETGHRQTFREYRDHVLAELRDASDPVEDAEATHEAACQEFDDIITPYGFALDDAIPGTFVELLRKVF